MRKLLSVLLVAVMLALLVIPAFAYVTTFTYTFPYVSRIYFNLKGSSGTVYEDVESSNSGSTLSAPFSSASFSIPSGTLAKALDMTISSSDLYLGSDKYFTYDRSGYEGLKTSYFVLVTRYPLSKEDVSIFTYQSSGTPNGVSASILDFTSKSSGSGFYTTQILFSYTLDPSLVFDGGYIFRLIFSDSLIEVLRFSVSLSSSGLDSNLSLLLPDLSDDTQLIFGAVNSLSNGFDSMIATMFLLSERQEQTTDDKFQGAVNPGLNDTVSSVNSVLQQQQAYEDQIMGDISSSMDDIDLSGITIPSSVISSIYWVSSLFDIAFDDLGDVKAVFLIPLGLGIGLLLLGRGLTAISGFAMRSMSRSFHDRPKDGGG